MAVEIQGFKTGIDRVSHQQPIVDETYAAVKKAPHPAIGVPQSRIKDLFDPHRTRDELEEFVRPRISAWALFIPARFKLLRKLIRKKLKKNKYDNASDEQKIDAAEQLLANEEELEQLFERYFHTLVKA